MFSVVFLNLAADTLSQETFYFQIKPEPEGTIKKRPINKGVERSSEPDKGGAAGNKLCMLLLGVTQDSSPFENYQAKHLSDTKISFLSGISNKLSEFIVVLQAKME